MIVYGLIIVVVVLALAALLLAGNEKRTPLAWMQFYARGKDAGFKFGEIHLLRKVAIKSDLEDPLALYWSVKLLDRCMQAIIRKNKLSGEDRDPSAQAFMAKLYDYRKKIELDQPKYKRGIQSSRSISEFQRLRLLVEGVGPVNSIVIKNNDKFITIARPNGVKTPPGFVWKGRRVSVYFWRRDDAGYVFDTLVLQEDPGHSAPPLHLAHSDSLLRTQKRRTVRAKVRISAYLYLPLSDEPPELPRSVAGLRCIIEDLSDSGCSVTIGGRGAPGMKVKLQFDLDGEPVVLTGTVKSVNYASETNRSLLHIAALPPSVATRNRIHAIVFGVKPDDELKTSWMAPPNLGAVPSGVSKNAMSDDPSVSGSFAAVAGNGTEAADTAKAGVGETKALSGDKEPRSVMESAGVPLEDAPSSSPSSSV